MEEINVSHRNIGVVFTPGNKAWVRVWAPYAAKVDIIIPQRSMQLSLHKEALGFWTLLSDNIEPGDNYHFIIDDEKQLPDPASLHQPEGVHGASQAVDTHLYEWTDNDWKNIPLEKYILYELHTGTFTVEGDFDGISKKLEHLKTLGITAIEIMPVAQFPGQRNWGYDGVYPFAAQNSYGGAKGLQKLVDACHSHGIAVVLDVVYNHLGPEGNYLEAFGPYFTGKYHTPWGKAVNFDDAWCDGVRQYVIENVLMWFRDFHIDALRLDAVHAIKDLSPKHILAEIKERVIELEKHTGRKHYLIAECDLNDTRFIDPLETNGLGMDAQWIDEFHHALRVTAGQPQMGYYSDFNGIEHLAKAYNDAYVYDGIYSPHRHKLFGTKATGKRGEQFIVFSQNHDQVGNRMLGERSSVLYSFDMLKLMAAAVFFSPYLPMIFMGEEYAETNPFLYFVSHTDPDLVEAVRKGRKAEFKSFHAAGEAPDPQSTQTFFHAKLQWHLVNTQPHAAMFSWYKHLIHLRKTQPALQPDRAGTKATAMDPHTLWLERTSEAQKIVCLFNFSKHEQVVSVPSLYEDFVVMINSAEEAQKVKLSNTLTLPPESCIAISNTIY